MIRKIRFAFLWVLLAVCLGVSASADSNIGVDLISFEPDAEGFQVDVRFSETDYSGKLAVFLTAEDFPSLTEDCVNSMIHAAMIPMPADGKYQFAIRRNVLENAAGSSDVGTKLYLIIGSEDSTTLHIPVTLEDRLSRVTGAIESYRPEIPTTIRLIPEDGDPLTCTIPAATGSGRLTQNFAFPEVKKGTYRLTVTKDGNLSYELTDIVIDGRDVDLTEKGGSPFRLISGDVNEDGIVSAMDIQKLWLVQNGYAEAPYADLNGDNRLDNADRAIILAPENFWHSGVKLKY